MRSHLQVGQSQALPEPHNLPSPRPEQHSQKTLTRQIDGVTDLPSSETMIARTRPLVIGRGRGRHRGQENRPPWAHSAPSKYCARE